VAGFRGPLFLLGISSAAVATQAGYTSVLPIPFTGGTEVVQQAGFIGPIPILNLGAGQALPEDIIEVASGGGSMWGREEVKRNDDDRVIMAVIKEFLRTVNQ
jgi:hypothetical protein